jgi:hypothetical protein
MTPFLLLCLGAALGYACGSSRYRWLIKTSTYGITNRQQAVLYLDQRLIAPDSKTQLSAEIDRCMTSSQ